MKLFPLLCLFALSLVQEGTSTHLETCECHEIRELVNASVQQAAARLEYKVGIMIDTAISNINITDETALSDLESRLTSTIQGLLKPIKTQLNYHLSPAPLPPTNLPFPPTTSTTLPPPSTTNLPTTPPPLPPAPGETAENPATSCKYLYGTLNFLSGYYWIGEIGSAVRVYCNMSLTCGDVTGGWMRVANIDMTNTSQNCPSGLDLITSPRRLCDTNVNGCASSYFNVHGAQYSHICGRIIGYQRSATIGFQYQSRGIDSAYVYGVSLTHGQNPREHIWTFAGSADESIYYPSWRCPCINTNINPPPAVPSYVGSDYFCDTAFRVRHSNVPSYQSIQVSDPLWDGEGCGSANTCCYDPQRKVNPPWFVKTLSSPTSDNIEMRQCHFSYNHHGSTPIEVVELYVQ